MRVLYIMIFFLAINSYLMAGNNALQSAQDVRAARFPDFELSPFLPDQKDTGNAATQYIQALECFEQDKEAYNLRENLGQLSQRPLILKAMARIFDGAHIKQCDFTIKYPPGADMVSSTCPDFAALRILANTMAYSSTQYAAKKDLDTAKEIARSILALGNHLRQSAYMSPQDFFGAQIAKIGAQQLTLIALTTNNYDEQKKLNGLIRNLARTESIRKAKVKLIQKDSPFWQLVGPLPASAKELLVNLQDAEPIYRMEGLQIIGTLYNTKYDTHSGLELAKDPNFVAFKNSRPKDLPVIRAKVSELAASDPDSKVQEVAKLVLDVLDKFENKPQS